MPADRSGRRGKRGKQGGSGGRPRGKRSGGGQRRFTPEPDQSPAEQPAPQTSAAPHNTSWDPVATWYTGWVGKSGSMYHRKSALPTVLRLAAPERGESLVDIGCGHGILARPVLKTGSSYLGVDFSPRLIEAAKAANPKSARFLHGDARELTGLLLVARVQVGVQADDGEGVDPGVAHLPQRLDLLDPQLIVADHADIERGVDLPQPLHQVVGKRVVVIDDQDHGGRRTRAKGS